MSGMMKNMMKQMGEGKTPEERLEMAKKMGAPEEALEKMKAAMGRENGEKGPNAKMGEMPGNKGTGGNPDMSAMMKAMMGKKAKEYSKEEVNKALAIMEVERTLKNVNNYKRALQESPDGELESLMNASFSRGRSYREPEYFADGTESFCYKCRGNADGISLGKRNAVGKEYNRDVSETT